MKRTVFLSAPLLLALAGCAAAGGDESLESHLRNPLYAERYNDDLAEQMVNLVLAEDPLLEDEGTAALVEATRVESLRGAEDANAKQREGLYGQIVSDYSYAIGEVLLLDGTLYIGPDFETLPGPDLRAHLSSTLDPREGTYPDESVLDLGTVKDLYGAHAYGLPEDTPENLRTFVLYDHELKRVYGFSQLSAR